MNPNIVWIDLETTGLDNNINKIVEIACVVTDSNLNKLDAGISVVIHYNNTEFEKLPNTVHTMHTSNGLIYESINSNETITTAEEKVLTYIQSHTVIGTSVLAGSCIGFDKGFLLKYMPKITDHLHYRIIDVSCFKNAATYWCPWVAPYKKNAAHRALADINESIEEMKYLKNAMFVTSS